MIKTKNIIQPIGIFDSGVGGVSVLREVVKILPSESIIYFADSKNCPYGNKSTAQIKKLSARIVKFLLKQRCKLIVVACNTISVSVIDYLRSISRVPLVAIEPATKLAASKTKTGKIGILATAQTFKGGLFNKTKKTYAKNIQVYVQAGHGLVEQIERGELNSPKTKKILKANLDKLTGRGIDQLVLGCTHYPFLIPLIKKITANKIGIIDSSPAVAKRVKEQLKKMDNINKPGLKDMYIFYTTGSKTKLQKLIPGSIKMPRVIEIDL